MGESTVIIVCENPACSQEFSKRKTEFNRSERLGRSHFCSLSCYGKFKGLINFKDKINRDTSHLRDIIRRDDFSPFRYHLRVMKKSAKRRNQDCCVTLLDLKLLWEQQNGICPYTGWNLVLLPCTTDYESTPLTINRASVDRIDSAIGYTPNNIQFVAVIANYAKNVFTEEQLINFCYAVYHYKKSGVDKSITFINLNINNTKNSCLGNRRDEYSPFRQHLISARKRFKSKGRECSITLEYLRELWEKQGGRCPYTGWELDNPQTTEHWNNRQLHPKTASLDRINTALGYVPGNVQFVSVIANFAKRDFLENELLEFCQAVVKYCLKYPKCYPI